jgi:hypothetical protein
MQVARREQVRLSSHRARPLWILICGSAFAALAGPVVAAPEALQAAEAVGSSWSQFTAWVAASYARAPALVLGLAALIAVPPLAIVGWLVRRREGEEMLDVSQQRTQVRRVRREAAPEPRDGVRTGHIPLRPLEAWIEVVNRSDVAPSYSDQRYNLGRTLLRIGRETDNDICLEDKTVHRYHAAIHRTEDAEFVITDLSSSGGNGVVVNGRSVAEARLASGDLIELGKAQLKFSAAPSR